MTKVIPAILENNISDIKQRIAQVKDYVDLIHLDVMDGDFVPNTTFNDPTALAKENLGIKIRVHLMISQPEFSIKKWNFDAVEAIVFHREAVNNMDEAIRLVRSINKKVGVAVNPKTSSYEIKDYLSKLDIVLVMGVVPGFSSQAFNSDVLDKIKYLKEQQPNIEIEVDGGVNKACKDKIIEAGADSLAANSYIFKSPDIKTAIESLM
ncbi:MAG: ribulose-phosphate 3-epimerase [Patescibacteria group bacterium]